MSTNRERTAIEAQRAKAQRAIELNSARSGIYAAGLASEGYDGGYRDAMSDALLILAGVEPQSRFR